MKVHQFKVLCAVLLGITLGSFRGFAGDALSQPVTAVLEQYLKIESALAKDSIDGVAEAATAIGKLASEHGQELPATLAGQAETLAKAKDLAVARAAFKPLSATLVQHLAQAKAQTGRYHEVYCDMAKANWLQDNKTVANPYYGSGMLRCGEVKRTF